MQTRRSYFHHYWSFYPNFYHSFQHSYICLTSYDQLYIIFNSFKFYFSFFFNFLQVFLILPFLLSFLLIIRVLLLIQTLYSFLLILHQYSYILLPLLILLSNSSNIPMAINISFHPGWIHNNGYHFCGTKEITKRYKIPIFNFMYVCVNLLKMFMWTYQNYMFAWTYLV